MKGAKPATAIVRIDKFQAELKVHVGLLDWPNTVIVKCVTEDDAWAEEEVKRLNALNGHKGCLYFATPSRIVSKRVAELEVQLEEAEEDNERLSDAAEQLAEVLRHRRKNAGHFCPDWDYMYIEKGDPEYEACSCFKEVQDGQGEGDPAG